jgi:hypothetical protein
MALRKSLILRKLQSSCLEGRTALIQPIVNFLTPSFAGATSNATRVCSKMVEIFLCSLTAAGNPC